MYTQTQGQQLKKFFIKMCDWCAKREIKNQVKCWTKAKRAEKKGLRQKLTKNKGKKLKIVKRFGKF